MAGKGRIVIDIEKCKGCGLCLPICNQDNLVISKESNRKGLFPVEQAGKGCTGCGMCAIICPEAAIEVYMDDEGPEENNSRNTAEKQTEEGK